MGKNVKRGPLPEWATQVTSLRRRLKINQAQLARELGCSPMTVSRWERGLLELSAEHLIRLGNLGEATEAWFFWEKAGINPAAMFKVLRGRAHRLGSPMPPSASPTGSDANAPAAEEEVTVVRIPLLKAVAGTHGVQGDRRCSLWTIAVSQTMSAPAPWCPNPGYTSLLRVKGHSMEPLIRSGDLVAVDSLQTEISQLSDKIIVAANDDKGFCVSRLRHYQNLAILEAEKRQYKSVVLSKASGWRVVAKVLWWISPAP